MDAAVCQEPRADEAVRQELRTDAAPRQESHLVVHRCRSLARLSKRFSTFPQFAIVRACQAASFVQKTVPGSCICARTDLEIAGGIHLRAVLARKLHLCIRLTHISHFCVVQLPVGANKGLLGSTEQPFEGGDEGNYKRNDRPSLHPTIQWLALDEIASPAIEPKRFGSPSAPIR